MFCEVSTDSSISAVALPVVIPPKASAFSYFSGVKLVSKCLQKSYNLKIQLFQAASCEFQMYIYIYMLAFLKIICTNRLPFEILDWIKGNETCPTISEC